MDSIQAQFNLTLAGQHYFVSQGNTSVPVWDLRSAMFSGNQNAIVFAHKTKAVPSPDGPDNVAWVELARDSGELANTVYRINTVKGQPPSTVSPSVDWWPIPFNQYNTSHSVTPAIPQVSSIAQNTVRLHVRMISAPPLLTCDVSSASLKRSAFH